MTTRKLLDESCTTATRKVNWRRGLLRVWVVASALWYVLAPIAFDGGYWVDRTWRYYHDTAQLSWEESEIPCYVEQERLLAPPQERAATAPNMQACQVAYKAQAPSFAVLWVWVLAPAAALLVSLLAFLLAMHGFRAARRVWRWVSDGFISA